MFRHVIQFHIPRLQHLPHAFFQSFGIAITDIIEILAAIILVFILLQTPFGGGLLGSFHGGRTRLRNHAERDPSQSLFKHI